MPLSAHGSTLHIRTIMFPQGQSQSSPTRQQQKKSRASNIHNKIKTALPHSMVIFSLTCLHQPLLPKLIRFTCSLSRIAVPIRFKKSLSHPKLLRQSLVNNMESRSSKKRENGGTPDGLQLFSCKQTFQTRANVDSVSHKDALPVHLVHLIYSVTTKHSSAHVQRHQYYLLCCRRQ